MMSSTCNRTRLKTFNNIQNLVVSIDLSAKLAAGT